MLSELEVCGAGEGGRWGWETWTSHRAALSFSVLQHLTAAQSPQPPLGHDQVRGSCPSHPSSSLAASVPALAWQQEMGLSDRITSVLELELQLDQVTL